MVGVRPILAHFHRKLLLKGNETNRTFLASLFFILCLSAWFCEIIGVHAFFGAFLAGIIVPKEGKLVCRFFLLLFTRHNCLIDLPVTTSLV